NDDGGLASSTAGGVHPCQLVLANGEHPQRVVVMKVVLAGDGQRGDVVYRAHLGRVDASLVEGRAVVGHSVEHVTRQSGEPAALQLVQLGARHHLRIWVEHPNFQSGVAVVPTVVHLSRSWWSRLRN